MTTLQVQYVVLFYVFPQVTSRPVESPVWQARPSNEGASPSHGQEAPAETNPIQEARFHCPRVQDASSVLSVLRDASVFVDIPKHPGLQAWPFSYCYRRRPDVVSEQTVAIPSHASRFLARRFESSGNIPFGSHVLGCTNCTLPASQSISGMVFRTNRLSRI